MYQRLEHSKQQFSEHSKSSEPQKLVPGSNPQNLDIFFLANLANYESLKRGAKDRNPLANNNFQNTSFTPSSPLKANRFCLSDKRSPNRQSIISDCQKAREHLAIVHRQVASILSDKIIQKSLSLFSYRRSPKGIACLAIVVKACEYLAIVLRQVASIN